MVPLLCQLIHERFSNKADKVGGNIFKDRRMEHRIGTLDIKNLIGNYVTRAVEIKKELFYKTRKLTEVFWTLSIDKRMCAASRSMSCIQCTLLKWPLAHLTN